MDVSFADDDLDRLETGPAFAMGLPQGVVRTYRMRMQMIRAAPDERDFRTMASLHFEKLKGTHQHSMRLNARLRLVIEIVGDRGDKDVRIVAIEDYH